MSVENVPCPDCGAANQAIRSFCDSCGAPLWVPEKQNTMGEPPANALETCKKATDEWRNALTGDEPDVLFWGHIASLLTLAVTYAGNTYFPRAHAHLAIALLSLGKDADAEREAKIALEQDPTEFRAQQVRVVLELNKELLREERMSGLIPFVHRRGERPGTQSLPSLKRNARYSKLDPTTIAAYDANPECLSAQSSLEAELERIVILFRTLCDGKTDVDEYLNLADFLIMAADGMRKMPFADWRVRLYSIVANTPTEKLGGEEREQEIEAIRQRARIGTLLFELKPEQRIARRRSSSRFAVLQ
jgi:hypothetical protein